MIIANLIFLGPSQGGRIAPPKSGFKPHIDMGGVHTSCIVRSVSGEEEFEFDRQHAVSLALMFPDQYKPSFKVGDAVNLYEGSKLIATGLVVSES